MLAEAGAHGRGAAGGRGRRHVHPGATVERLGRGVDRVRAARAEPLRPVHRRRRARRAWPRRCTARRTGSRPPSPRRTSRAGRPSHTSMIENFFGFVEGIGGAELARLAGRQAERFGAELLILNGVVRAAARARAAAGAAAVERRRGDVRHRRSSRRGMEWRRLELDGVEELLGHGVYYGAGRSEAVQCAGEDVMVVGAGNSAGQAVMNLASAGARVTHGRARRQPLEVDVRVPGGPDRGAATRSTSGSARRVTRAARRGGPARGGDDRERRRRRRDAAVSRRSSCASAACRAPGGRRAAASAPTANGFILTGPDLLEDGRRPEELAARPRPARARDEPPRRCSPPATCGTAP